MPFRSTQPWPPDAAEPVVVERAEGPGGELVLRAAHAGHYEIISNGTFLMDTRNGESERLLVEAALGGLAGPGGPGRPEGAGVRVLVGGLGVGFTLAEALRHERVAEAAVVEREPAVIGWHREGGPLAPFSRGALADPRVRVHRADLVELLTAGPAAMGGRFDVVCLDIDNGPDWTVTPGNARLYGPEGLAALRRALTGRGRLAVWSAGASPAFEERLRERFAAVDALPVPVPRGEPDMIYLARDLP
ncbi:spermidine synthase [Spirillospora sp. NPDC029432]|uniref:spermidine synthase n=1 Tax=Spirillospora sp. NPDC029432 TaxID=3154599 RepID=UPI003457344B